MQKLLTLSEINARLAALDAVAARRRLTLAEREEYRGLCVLHNVEMAKHDRDVAARHNYRAGRAR